MKIRFACPGCERPARVRVSGPAEWQCPDCDHLRRLSAPAELSACPVCGNPELYKKKDFPHWLGMTILVTALILSTLTYHWYEKWWSWSFLIGSAIIDAEGKPQAE